MLAVTGVDDMGAGNIGDLAGHAGMLVAHDDHVDLVSAQGFHGVHQAFALDGGGGGAAEVQAVAAQALFGDFEGGARTGRRLVEHVHYREALQGRNLLDTTLVNGPEALGGLQDLHDVISRVLGDVDQMLVVERH